MTCLCEISGFRWRRIPVAQSVMVLLVVFMFFSSVRPAAAKTSVYIFDPNHSTVTRSGGFIGIPVTYSIAGRFQLNVDDTGLSVFKKVDAVLTDEAGSVYSQSLAEVFNMNGLVGDLAGAIIFKGKTADGTDSDVYMELAREDGQARLTGRTTPPPNSADMFIYSIDATASRKYAGGTGEPNDPYKIATAEDLIALGETPEDYDKHFIMTADIDLDPNLPGRKVFDRAVVAPDTNDIQDGLQGTPFSGVFDGNSYTISHLTIMGSAYLGLFGQLGSFPSPGGEVKNMMIVDVNVSGSGSFIGGLVGHTYPGTVTHCYSIGTIHGGQYVGGLVGANDGNVSLCSSSGSVNGIERVGGLTGLSRQGCITQCCSNSAVNGSSDVGGLVGSILMSSVTQCYSNGPVSGIESVGGLVGNNGDGYIIESYSSGFVNGTGPYVGGLVGRSYLNAYSSCFWDVETSGQMMSAAGGTGKTTAEMQTAGTFLEAGWDFAGETANGTEDIWWIDEGKSYPRLWWEPRKYGGGIGELNDPYLIYTAEQLNAIGAEPNDWDKHFKLMADIDLSGYIYDAALIAPDNDPDDPAFQGIPFKGTFDGNFRTISHLTIQGAGYLGLFGRLDAKAAVDSLKLADVNVVGSDYVGALVGFNYGHISKVYTNGTVSGNNRIGGLTGRNWGNIDLSHNAAEVTGNNDVGGIMAANYGSITNSYNTGALAGNIDVGGITGENYGSITFTYNTGLISGHSRAGGLVGFNWQDAIVTSSFWDIETSGQTTSDGGTGKTTAEMQTKKTFTDAGWDFVDETANGAEDNWTIDEGQDYPRLWWELIPIGN